MDAELKKLLTVLYDLSKSHKDRIIDPEQLSPICTDTQKYELENNLQKLHDMGMIKLIAASGQVYSIHFLHKAVDYVERFLI